MCLSFVESDNSAGRCFSVVSSSISSTTSSCGDVQNSRSSSVMAAMASMVCLYTVSSSSLTNGVSSCAADVGLVLVNQDEGMGLLCLVSFGKNTITRVKIILPIYHTFTLLWKSLVNFHISWKTISMKLFCRSSQKYCAASSDLCFTFSSSPYSWLRMPSAS